MLLVRGSLWVGEAEWGTGRRMAKLAGRREGGGMMIRGLGRRRVDVYVICCVAHYSTLAKCRGWCSLCALEERWTIKSARGRRWTEQCCAVKTLLWREFGIAQTLIQMLIVRLLTSHLKVLVIYLGCFLEFCTKVLIFCTIAMLH